MALEDKTLPDDPELNPSIVESIKARQVEGKLPCVRAFLIVDDLDVPATAVGETADVLGVKLSRCQLGLFGYPGKQGWSAANIDDHPVPDDLRPALRNAADTSGKLACIKAWELADRFEVPRMLVGYLADQLGIHIAPCQLGAF